MKYKLALLLLLLAPLSKTWAQDTPTTPSYPPGSVTGDAVPDSVAYRMVFISLSVPANPSASDTAAQASKVNAIGLSPVDSTALVADVSGFVGAYSSIYQQWKTKTLPAGASASSQRDGLINSIKASLQHDMSAAGWTAFSAYVTNQKVRIHTVPE